MCVSVYVHVYVYVEAGSCKAREWLLHDRLLDQEILTRDAMVVTQEGSLVTRFVVASLYPQMVV